MARGLSSNPFIREALQAIEKVNSGSRVDDIETLTLDCKEEAGRRRGAGHSYGPGGSHNEAAARALAEEAACLANTEGGVLLVGIADKGVGPDAFIGAELDTEWLREKIWEYTEPHLGAEVVEHYANGVRLLFLLVPRGFRLHRSARKFKHRIGSSCVEMSAEEQRRAEEDRTGYDWSAEPSEHTLAEVSAAAVDLVRRYLRETGDASRIELADRPTPDLLRRLGVLAPGDQLTRAGSLLFVAGDRVLIDYKRRRVPGGPSVDRQEEPAPLIEAYTQVKRRIDAVNEERELQLPSGVHPRIKLIPDRAVREALVNAIIHRDYRQAEAVDVEFVGAELVVASPGGFPPGITEANIISERSHPRNLALANVFRSLRLAEQEGVGVDRMFRDMVSVGHAVPTIADRGGRVRCVLVGGEPSEPVVALIASLPQDAQDDVDLALILHVLLERANVAAAELTGVLQKLEPECLTALRRCESVGVLQQVSWTTRALPRWRLSDAAREQLRGVLPYVNSSASDSEEFLIRHLQRHDSIRPRDVADILGVTEDRGGRILRELREAEVLAFGSEQERGRGVFHVPGPRFDDALRRHGLAS